ncbi:hypothetical protein [Bradyrhizobium sp. th.b2]|uniref:hypothetical protein n=1 Tax=Bradyrhizobium sp. th-b2 TaxID=172088 RepID=UPI0006888638|nr:hypothetical protein [Bradyrhizobium sp. th.b2]
MEASEPLDQPFHRHRGKQPYPHHAILLFPAADLGREFDAIKGFGNGLRILFALRRQLDVALVTDEQAQAKEGFRVERCAG